MITKDDGNPATNDEWITSYSYDVSNNLQITNTDPEGIVSVEDGEGREAVIKYDKLNPTGENMSTSYTYD